MNTRYVLRAAFCALAYLGAGRGATIPCVATTGIPPIVPATGSALVGEVVLSCSNTAPDPINLTLDVQFSLNTAVTSQVIDGSGNLEALLLINEPAPMEMVIGTNAFYGTLSAPNTISWPGTTVTFAGNAMTYFRFNGIRVNTLTVPIPEFPVPGQVIGNISFGGSGESLFLTNPQQTVAFVTGTAAVPEPASLLLVACGGVLIGAAAVHRKTRPAA